MRGNMTTGAPGKAIMMFSLPLLAGNLFQQFYNMIDSMVLGQFVGMGALAAVGSTFPIVYLVNAIAMGITTGASILLSQLFGNNRKDEFQRAVYTTLLTIVALSIIITLLGEAMVVPFLRLLNLPPQHMPGSTLYLRILFLGTGFIFTYNSFSAIFRAIGNSRTPLIFLIVASAANIILDLVFVLLLGWDIAGVALATIMAQALSALLFIFYTAKKVPFLWPGKEFRVFDKEQFRRILHLGVPAMIQQVSVAVSIFFVQGMVNQFGESVMAGYTSASKIETLAMMPMFNISSGLSTYTAQNIGANQLDRVKKGLHITLRLSLGICGGIALVIYCFRTPFASLFLKSGSSAEAFAFCLGYLRVVCLFYLINTFYNTLSGILRGAGDARTEMAISILSLVIRVSSSKLLLQYSSFGFAAIWWGLPISWCVGALCVLLRYLSGRWKLKAIRQ